MIWGSGRGVGGEGDRGKRGGGTFLKRLIVEDKGLRFGFGIWRRGGRGVAKRSSSMRKGGGAI